MSDTVWVDTERLVRAVPGLTELSHDVAGVYSDLIAELNGLGRCWGDDATGQAFERQYIAPRDELLMGMRDTRDVIDSTGQGILTMVKGYTATEEGNTVAVHGVTADPHSPGHAGTP